VAIVLASKPGITGGSTLSIPKSWDPTWFRGFIANQLKGADVRNAVGANGISITGNIASPYATIGFGAPVTIPGPVTINGAAGSTALTVNAAAGQIAITANTGPIYSSLESGSSFLLNALGADFGSIFTSNTQTWALGYATTATSAPTAVLSWSQPGSVTIAGGVNVTALVVDAGSTGASSTAAQFVNGAGSQTWTAQILNNSAATGVNFGLLIEAGTNASDEPLNILDKTGTVQQLLLRGNGTLFVRAGLGVNGATPPTQVTGFGTPTGNVVVANFPGATATLVQCSETIAEILTIIKQIGFIGA